MLSIVTTLMLVKKVLGSLSRAWLLLMRVTTFILLAENSWNEVKHISELQVAFENISKNFTKSASKNLGVWKSNFPSVHTCYSIFSNTSIN